MIYINGRGCVSAQKTFDGSFPEEVIVPEGQVLPVVAPPYKEYISPGMIRRMGSGVKNGVVASALALREAGFTAGGASLADGSAAGSSGGDAPTTGTPVAGTPQLDAIITGTGVGCIKDSETFLTAILENGEEFLTPTAFIQSTHNTVGAQIALGLGCKAYNFSYVNGAISFESALVDARLQLLSGEARNILVGGVDEKADFTYRLFGLAGLIKTDERAPGASYSEGAAFFVLSTEKKEQSYAVLKDVAVMNHLEPGSVAPALTEFLQRTGTALADIDSVVIGKNDDILFQEYYPALLSGFSPGIPVIHYKHLSGEFNTASAFGFWLAAGILKSGQIPAPVLLGETPLNSALSGSISPGGGRLDGLHQGGFDIPVNLPDNLSPGGAPSDGLHQGSFDIPVNLPGNIPPGGDPSDGAPSGEGVRPRNILLYNQYRGIDHSFILLSGC